MPVRRQHQIRVYLVHREHDAVVYAYPSDALQLLARPRPAHGIVRAAKYHEPDVRLLRQSLERGEVHLPAPAALDEGIVGYLPPRAAHIVVVGIVDRRLDYNALARRGVHLHRADKGHVDARSVANPLGLHLPAVPLALPAGAGVEVFPARVAIAVGLVRGALLYRLGHAGRGLEVHVRYAHGYDAAVAVHLPPELRRPFDGHRRGAVYRLVEVEVHALAPFNFRLRVV